MFNFINTSRKFRGGGNRKTEIQKKGGWGVAGFLFMYLSTIICNGGHRGWGSWGVLYASPALALPSSSSLVPSPLGCYPFNLFLAPVARDRGS